MESGYTVPRSDSDTFAIPVDRFDNSRYIEERVASAAPGDAGALRTALSYLYETLGPVNLPRDRFLAARRYFDRIEAVLVPWLQTRTNGSERGWYGADSLRAARVARYRCEECGHADVRTLNFDHVEGRVAGTPFACLCANCHAIKSRERDWTGRKRAPEAR